MDNKIKTLTADDYARSGLTLFNKHLNDTALACFRRAVAVNAITPGMLPSANYAYLLGNCLWQLKLYQESEKELLRSIALEPSYPEPLHILANLYTNTGRFGLAERCFLKALELFKAKDAYSRDVACDYSLFLLYIGRYREGFEAFEARRDHFKAAYIDSIPQWDGETDISQSTLYVYSEQGIGDIIQFSRFLPEIRKKCGKLIFGVPPELIPLFRAFPKNIIDVLIPRLLENKPPVADYCLPLVSTVRFVDSKLEDYPADPGGYFKELAKARPFKLIQPSDPETRKIGIVWSGNPTHSRDRERSIALETLIPLTCAKNVQLYSLQVGNRSSEVEMIGAQTLVYQLESELTDWSKTASALLEFDLIISVDTAVAHLAGALNVPCWLMISTTCDWRWGVDGESTMWYPSIRLFRQTKVGDWKSVVERMIREINNM